jgi:hypothetical protein
LTEASFEPLDIASRLRRLLKQLDLDPRLG